MAAYVMAATLAGVSGSAQSVPLSRASAAIALYTGFEHPCPDAVLESLHRQLASIMAPAGIYFEWRSLDDPAQRNRPAAELAVIQFKGACAMPGDPGRRPSSGALGWTHITDGELLSFADVDCDRIRALIERPVRHWARLERERALGRALALVVAHELFHIFANTRRHADRGLLRQNFGPRELVGADLQFAPDDLLAMRENKLRWLFRRAPLPPSGH